MRSAYVYPQILMTHQTEQEDFWAGEFGNDYTRRNRGLNWVAANTAFFTKVLDFGGCSRFRTRLPKNLLAQFGVS